MFYTYQPICGTITYLILRSAPLTQAYAAYSSDKACFDVVALLVPLNELFLKFEPRNVPGQYIVIDRLSFSSIYSASKKPLTANFEAQ